jgi:cytochrome b561
MTAAVPGFLGTTGWMPVGGERMHWQNSPGRYGVLGQSLHWLVVAGIIASYFLAEAAEDEAGDGLMSLHQSVGIAVLVLAVVRVVWRLVDGRPAWPPGMAPWERMAARVAHALLYALLFALPLTGWLTSSAEGDAVSFFGLVDLPPLRAGLTEDAAEELHEALFNVLLAVAALHVAAALKHLLWDRDGVMGSMLPGRRRTGLP